MAIVEALAQSPSGLKKTEISTKTRIPLGGGLSVFITLITPYGVKKNSASQSLVEEEITMDDLS